jgi:hypothetical protein
MIKQVKTYKNIAYPDYRSSFGGKYQFSVQEGVLNKSSASYTQMCPVLPYRATYYRNTIIYKILRICQGEEGWKINEPQSQP